MIKILYSDISDYRFKIEDLNINCNERKVYIESIKDEKRKIQSLLVWRLLEFSIKKFFEKNFSFVNEYGKWKVVDGNFNFSITHSNNIVAVCISDAMPVGVDVEMLSEKILKVKTLFDENKCFNDEVDYLTLKWTEKESAFKCTEKGKTFSSHIFDKLNNKYYLSACTNDTDLEMIKINLSEIL